MDDIDNIINECWQEIEEIKNCSQLDADGENKHFLSLSEKCQLKWLKKVLSIEGYLTRPIDEIVSKAIEMASPPRIL